MVGVIVGHGKRVVKDRASLKERHAMFTEVVRRFIRVPYKLNKAIIA